MKHKEQTLLDQQIWQVNLVGPTGFKAQAGTKEGASYTYKLA